MSKIIVSACLAGINCRYDGTNCVDPEVEELVEQGQAFPVCPEQLGGLPTPREKSIIVGGNGRDVIEGRAKVVTIKGEDVTENFLRGAEESLKLAKKVKARRAILKQKSPSCGYGLIYKEGKLASGMGVTAALLAKERIEIIAI